MFCIFLVVLVVAHAVVFCPYWDYLFVLVGLSVSGVIAVVVPFFFVHEWCPISGMVRCLFVLFLGAGVVP